MLPLLVASAFAAGLQPTLDTSLSASYFPEGLLVRVRPGLKLPLWNHEGSLLFSDTWVRGRLVAEATPSFGRVGPELGFSPIAVLELRVNYQASAYFGTFSSVKPLGTADAVATDAVLEALPNHTGFQHRVVTEATLQGKVGPVVAAVWGGPQWWWTTSDAERRGDFWWEPETELVMAWDERVLSGGAVVLYQHDSTKVDGRQFFVGGYGEARTAESTDDRIVRAGLMGVLVPDRRFSLVALVLAQVEHRIEPTPFPPYLALQFAWNPLEKKPGVP